MKIRQPLFDQTKFTNSKMKETNFIEQVLSSNHHEHFEKLLGKYKVVFVINLLPLM